MSGLLSFSKGLNNISANVANLNTPGFKRSSLEFSDLFYRNQLSDSGNGDISNFAQGSGVKTGESFTQFAQGEFRQTGGDLDVAIDGAGFFIVKGSDGNLYTRNGQFVLNDAGELVTRDGGLKVMAQEGGGLGAISIAGRRSSTPIATSAIHFSGSLSTSATSFDVSGVSIIDSLGGQHDMTLKLVNDSATTPGNWKFTLVEGAATIASGEVRYSGGGTPVAGFETSTITFTPTSGATPSSVVLDFSASNAFSSSSSDLKVSSADGRLAGVLTKTTIDTNGFLNLQYSNGDQQKTQQLALATFNNLNALQSVGSARFTVFAQTDRLIGTAGQAGFGKLQSGTVELSNVQLAQEFSDLIIVQRGYQASSQVITTANEMIQQLADIRGRK